MHTCQSTIAVRSAPVLRLHASMFFSCLSHARCWANHVRSTILSLSLSTTSLRAFVSSTVPFSLCISPRSYPSRPHLCFQPFDLLFECLHHVDGGTFASFRHGCRPHRVTRPRLRLGRCCGRDGKEDPCPPMACWFRTLSFHGMGGRFSMDGNGDPWNPPVGVSIPCTGEVDDEANTASG